MGRRSQSINALIEERCAKVDHWQNSSQRHRWLVATPPATFSASDLVVDAPGSGLAGNRLFSVSCFEQHVAIKCS